MNSIWSHQLARSDRGRGATALIAAVTGTNTLTEGITLGLVTGIGYALPMVGVEATFDPNKPQPLTWFGITGVPPDRLRDPGSDHRRLALRFPTLGPGS